MGPRRYTIGALFIGVIGFIDWFYDKLEAADIMTQLIGIPSWIVAIWFLAFLIIWWLLEYVVRLRRQIKGSYLELAELRKSGVELRNLGRHLISSKVSWAQWESDVINWNTNVIACLEKANEAAAEWFGTLDVVPGRMRVKILEHLADKKESNAHIKLYKEHDFSLVRLERLIWTIWIKS